VTLVSLPRPPRTALDQLDAEIRKLHEEAAFGACKTCFNPYDVTLRRCLAPRRSRCDH
jgi:hypothetical protein